MSDTDQPSAQLTAEERGDSSVGRRSVSRVGIVIGLVLLVAGVVAVGNFARTGAVLPEAPVVSSTDTALTDSEIAATADPDEPDPAALVAADDARLTALGRLAADDPATVATYDTVILPNRDSAYTLADLVERGAARQDEATVYTLVRNVVVRAGARLELDGAGTTLRLTSTADGYVSLIAWGGDLQIRGGDNAPFTIIAWDDSTGAADLIESDGRAYVRVRDGLLDASSARFESLGFWSGRTGGVAVTATSLGLASATLDRTTHTGMHIGLFLSSVTTASVTGITVAAPSMAGIQITDGSHDVTVTGSTVDAAGTDGIEIERASNAIWVTDSTVTNAFGVGLKINGAALATGPNTAGFPTTRSAGFTITGTTLDGNADGGIALVGADDVAIDSVTVTGASIALHASGPSTGLTVVNSTMSSTGWTGVLLDEEVIRTQITSSAVSSAITGVRIANAQVSLLGNTVTVGSGSAIDLADGARADVVENTLVGAGTDAIAVSEDSVVVDRDNDLGGWRLEWAWLNWIGAHPTVFLWLLVLVIPVIGLPLLVRRARRHRELRALLEDAIVRYGAAQIAAYGTDDVVSLTQGRGDGTGASDVATGPARGSGPGRSAEAPSPIGGAPRRGAPSRFARPDVGAAPRSLPASGAAQRAGVRGAGAGVGAGAGANSLADLRTGPLANREFASLQQFAVAAVLEAGYPIATIAKLFRLPSWRLQEWVEQAVSDAERGADGP